MRIAFVANDGGFDADEYALVCGLSGGEHYLTFQRDAEGASEDWGVHLEYADQSKGGDNCVRSCHLSRESLRVDLCRQLGNLAGVVGFDVTLSFDEASFAALQEGLQRVFLGKSGMLHLA